MYDPTDEATDQLFATLLHVLREAPTNMSKQALARLFEDGAVRQILMEEAGAEPSEPSVVEEAFARHWDRVEALRNDLAANFLNALQREEF